MEGSSTKSNSAKASASNGDDDLASRLDQMQKLRNALHDEVAKVIIGQEGVVRLLLAGVFSGGHCLLVGVPGLAKTALVKALAGSLQLKFKRIQFTPDMMPADITGTHVLMEDAEGRRKFEFVEGPLFANVILASFIRGPAM